MREFHIPIYLTDRAYENLEYSLNENYYWQEDGEDFYTEIDIDGLDYRLVLELIWPSDEDEETAFIAFSLYNKSTHEWYDDSDYFYNFPVRDLCLIEDQEEDFKIYVSFFKTSNRKIDGERM